MDWRFDGGAPIYGQIVEKVKLSIASGALAPGERLPAVRELALSAGVNPNTVQRALSELEREGLVYTLRTSGRYVTEDRNIIDRARRELAERSVRSFLGAMETLGYTRAELHGLIDKVKMKEEE